MLEIDRFFELVYPSYDKAVRKSQIKMAEAVQRTLHSGKKLIVEAGTGTGKTAAYLLPAVEKIKKEGKPFMDFRREHT